MEQINRKDLPSNVDDFLGGILSEVKGMGVDPMDLARAQPVNTEGRAFTYSNDTISWVRVRTIERWMRDGFDARQMRGDQRGLHVTARRLSEAETERDVAAVFAQAFLHSRTRDVFDGWRGKAFALLHTLAAMLNKEFDNHYHHASTEVIPVSAVRWDTAPPDHYLAVAHLIAVDMVLCHAGHGLVRASGVHEVAGQR